MQVKHVILIIQSLKIQKYKLIFDLYTGYIAWITQDSNPYLQSPNVKLQVVKHPTPLQAAASATVGLDK